MATASAVTIDDDYEHEDSDLEYILENVLCEEISAEDNDAHQLRELYNSSLTNPCNCTKSTDHCNAMPFCFHSGNYLMNAHVEPPELVLASTRKIDVFCECSTACSCKQNCQNRRVQLGPRKNLKIIESETFRSKGLATTAFIPKGAFICEYAGELLTQKEAQKRILDNKNNGRMNYILCLNEIKEGCLEPKKNCLKTIVDPSRKGNIGRYFNHSCDPNCEIYSVRVDCPIPKICLFSKRNIEAGEELSFHYGGEQVNAEFPIQQTERVVCSCKSENCEKFLPNIAF